MLTSVYVGNLPSTATTEQIENLFGTYGVVERVTLVTDRETGTLKGFGFVDMSDGALEAMANLNQSELDGQIITVNSANPRKEPPRQSRRR